MANPPHGTRSNMLMATLRGLLQNLGCQDTHIICAGFTVWKTAGGRAFNLMDADVEVNGEIKAVSYGYLKELNDRLIYIMRRDNGDDDDDDDDNGNNGGGSSGGNGRSLSARKKSHH